MATRESIVTEAMAWRGTPFHHAASLKRVGCDCVGLLIGISKGVGILAPAWKPPVYSREWHVHKNEELLRQTMEKLGCIPVPLDERQPGHILVFQFGRVLSHAGILVSTQPERLVHAVVHESVRYHGLNGDLLTRLRAVYAFPEVRSS
jgi:NlpC/P60 family putative phage cell wall peptidase